MRSMDQLGELLRDLLAPIYPLRVQIAVGALAGMVILALVARRRGWFAAARRHPGRTTVAAAAALAITLPLGWYMLSPLLIRTALEEPAPTGGPTAPAPSPAASPSGGPTGTAEASPAASPTQASRSGDFVGADDFHFGSGRATLVEVSPGSWTVRFESFSVRNGPDLYVYLSPSPDGYAEGAVELGTLRATDGSFNTDVPAGIDVAAMRSVVIWCKAFSVTFAHAPLA